MQSSVPLRSIFGKSWVIFRTIGLIHFDVYHTGKGGFQSRCSFVGTFFAAANLIGIVTLLVVNDLNPPPLLPMTDLRSSWFDATIFQFSEMLGPLVLLVHWSKTRTLSSLVKRILEVDCKLYGLTRQPLNRSGHCNACLSLAFHGFTLAVGLVISLLLNFLVILPPVTWIVSGWCRVVVLMSNYQLVVLLVLVRTRFEILNHLLFRKIQRQTNSSNKQSLTDTNSTQEDFLPQLAIIYDDLKKSLSKLNKAFSIQLTLNVLDVFLETLFMLFLLVRIQLSSGEEVPTATTWTMLLMSMLQIVNLAVVVSFFQVTEYQASKTPKSVHKVYNTISDTGQKDKLLLFSKQLLEGKFIFTAGNMFPMDFSIFYTMICAVSAYIVILVQFQFF